jgi:ribosomal protein S18 acetylase RimI-like enzyme
VSRALTIRAARADDEAAVVALWRACGLTVAYNDPIRDFRFARGRASSDILLGETAGVLRASVMVGHDGHRGWMYYVSADPDARRAGFGRRIVEAGEDWLRERGVAKVMLMVRDTNTVAVPFYEKLGYENTPRIVMSKWLTDDP